MNREEGIVKYIIEFTAYDLEPLHIIVSALISERLCESPKAVVECIVELVKKNYLVVYTHSGVSGAPYIKVDVINEEELFSDVEKRNQFENYPEGKEYFFRATDKGLSIIEELNSN